MLLMPLATTPYPRAPMDLKLIPPTNVIKSRLAAMISVFGHPHHDLDAHRDERKTRPEVEEQSDAG